MSCGSPIASCYGADPGARKSIATALAVKCRPGSFGLKPAFWTRFAAAEIQPGLRPPGAAGGDDTTPGQAATRSAWTYQARLVSSCSPTTAAKDAPRPTPTHRHERHPAAATRHPVQGRPLRATRRAARARIRRCGESEPEPSVPRTHSLPYRAEFQPHRREQRDPDESTQVTAGQATVRHYDSPQYSSMSANVDVDWGAR